MYVLKQVVGCRSLEHRYSEQVDSKKSQRMRHGNSRESGVSLVRVPKKLPKERPVCLFPFDLLQRDCTLLHPAPTISKHHFGV